MSANCLTKRGKDVLAKVYLFLAPCAGTIVIADGENTRLRGNVSFISEVFLGFMHSLCGDKEQKVHAPIRLLSPHFFLSMQPCFCSSLT